MFLASIVSCLETGNTLENVILKVIPRPGKVIFDLQGMFFSPP
jgi:hypothetical protein